MLILTFYGFVYYSSLIKKQEFTKVGQNDKVEDMEINTDPKKIDEILERGTVVEILPTKKEFKERLLSGDKLRFYIGFDATAPNLHLSHAKNFMFMEKIRQLGHEVIILFGDFTARIGDPTGEDSKRKQLTRKEVLSNVKAWIKMVKPFMSFDDKKNPPKIMYNHEWLSKLTFEDVIDLASSFTVQQMITRDMFQKRLENGKPIHLHEFFYPLMQGYDSVAMDVDVEVCGTDQTFNALAGRTLLKKMKNKEKFVVALTLMENPKTGDLMSKSKGTGVFLDGSAEEMFGQIMAQPDEMMEILFINNTLIEKSEIKNILKKEEPKNAKLILAFEITSLYHGEKNAEKAKEYWEKTFSKKETPNDIKEINVSSGSSLKNVLVSEKLLASNSEFQRRIDGGAIKNMETGEVLKEDIKLEKDITIKYGKKDFVKIIVK